MRTYREYCLAQVLLARLWLYAGQWWAGAPLFAVVFGYGLFFLSLRERWHKALALRAARQNLRGPTICN